MATPVLGAQGTYTDVTGIITAATKLEIYAAIDVMSALYTPADGESASNTDFNLIPLHVREKLADEIVAMKAAIDAAPIA